MTGGDVLFDTNAFIAWTLDSRVFEEKLSSSFVPHISVVTVGELRYGIRNSSRSGENLRKLDHRLRDFKLLPIDEDTAEFYPDIRMRLKIKGLPIPVNDLWIAATALQHELTLLTNDKHFDAVDFLSRMSWQE